MSLPNSLIVAYLADAEEVWKQDHQAAMQCRELETVLAKGLHIFTIIRSSDENWSKKVCGGAAVFDAHQVREIRKMYEWWLGPCDGLLDQIARMEAMLYAVEHAAEFRKSVSFARSVTQTPIEDLLEGLAQLYA